MTGEEFGKLRNERTRFSQQIPSADIAFENSSLSMELKRRILRFFPEVGARLEGRSWPAIDHQPETTTDGHEPLIFSTNFRRASPMKHTAHYEPLLFQALPFLLFHRLLSTWRAFHPPSSLYLILSSILRRKSDSLVAVWSPSFQC